MEMNIAILFTEPIPYTTGNHSRFYTHHTVNKSPPRNTAVPRYKYRPLYMLCLMSSYDSHTYSIMIRLQYDFNTTYPFTFPSYARAAWGY